VSDIKSHFNGGVAVITGSGSGIGRALALNCAALGMKVVVAELSKERGETVAAEITAAGGEALFVQTDVTSQSSVDALAAQTKSAFGAVTLLVNNAGVMVLGNVWEISEKDWDLGIDVNLRGVIRCIQAFVPDMLKSDKPGYIANVSSLAGVCSIPNESQYVLTKHAVLALSESLYMEMQGQAKPLQVSVVLPGLVNTRIFDDSKATTTADADLGEARSQALKEQGLSAKEAAEIILTGVAAGDYWITTHPEALDFIAKDRGGFLSERPMPRVTPNPFD
jgi:NAD(P)-dependent dehydrogenase (short-subunit alcohol dehydrogenase family)